MSDMDNLIGALHHEAHALEHLGNSIAVEARELHHAADALAKTIQDKHAVGLEYENQAAIEAAFDKLSDGISREIRYQKDSLIDVTRTIR